MMIKKEVSQAVSQKPLMNRKEKLIAVFDDTQDYYTNNQSLADAVQRSRNAVKLYTENDYPKLPKIKRTCSVTVTKSKSFEAAMRLHNEYPNAKIAVLNFASATNPGGGVKKGSSAQEEGLCRCSTLYPTLNQHWLWEQYYLPNRKANDPLHTDVCIYSPDIVICKTDESIPQRLSKEQFVTVDIITCAAPNLRFTSNNKYNLNVASISKQDLLQLHIRRAKHILHIAAANGVDILILGAFGCGAFMNDPNIVAKAYAIALENYRDYFEKIEFAIYCRDGEMENYKAFKHNWPIPIEEKNANGNS
jgi:uncharacterized protein (TIGR02452 family)